MTVFFASSELESFRLTNPSNCYTSTTSGRFDSTFSRSCFYFSEADGNANGFTDFSDVSELWIHLSIYDSQAYSTSTSTNTSIIRFINSTIADPILFRISKTGNSTFNFQAYNGSSYVNLGSGFGFPSDALFTLDVHLKIHTTNGIVRIYTNGTLLYEFTGNTRLYTSTGGDVVNRLLLRGRNDTIFDFAPAYSQVIIANEPTLKMNLGTVFPNASGSESEWTGSVSDINENGLNNSNFIYTSSIDMISTFNTSDRTIPPNNKVKAVTVGSQIRRGTTGPQNAELLVKPSTINYSSSLVNLSTSFEGYNRIWENNPDTSNIWTQTDINNLQIGIKSKS